MNNRGLIITSLLGLSSVATAQQKPNILFIFADDMRASTIHALGNDQIITPNLDMLVADGTAFTAAHVMGGTSGAISMPSRAMLMTGRSLFNLKDAGEVIPEDQTTYGEQFQRAGYNTFATGKWHSDRAAFARSFTSAEHVYFGGMADHWSVPLYNYDYLGRYDAKIPSIPQPSKNNIVTYKDGNIVLQGKHSSEIFTDAAIDYLSNYKDDKPFMMYVAYMAPHDPRSTYQKYMDMYDVDKIRLPENFKPEHPFDNGEMMVRDEMLAAFPRTETEVKAHIRDYYATITHLDAEIGRLIASLKASGQYDNTIIVFAADNGLAVGQHGLMGKQNMYEHSIGVPLVFSGKGIAKARQTPAMCYLYDIFPTLADLAGVDTPASSEGRSLVPVLNGEQKSTRGEMYYAYLHIQRALCDGRFKLIEYNVKGVRNTQLFDLSVDPMETKDLSVVNKRQVAKMRARLIELSAEFNDNYSPFYKNF